MVDDIRLEIPVICHHRSTHTDGLLPYTQPGHPDGGIEHMTSG